MLAAPTINAPPAPAPYLARPLDRGDVTGRGAAGPPRADVHSMAAPARLISSRASCVRSHIPSTTSALKYTTPVVYIRFPPRLGSTRRSDRIWTGQTTNKKELSPASRLSQPVGTAGVAQRQSN